DYNLTISKTDLTGQATSCNSLTGALTYGPAPPNYVVANTILNGLAQRNPPDAATVCAIASVPVVHPDVRVIKTGDTKVIAGNDAHFNISVSAIGEVPSTNVVLTDSGLDTAKVTVGGTNAADCLPIVAGTLTCNFGTLDPAGIVGPISKSITLTHHTSMTQCPYIQNTAQVTADHEEDLTNNSSTATILVNGCGNPPVKKSPRVLNLWLCKPIATCANPPAGVGQVDFNVELNAPITSLEPKCPGVPTPTPTGPLICPVQQIGSFEFEVRFDSKLVSVTVDAGPIFQRTDVLCTSVPTQNAVQFHCNISGKPIDATSGPGVLAIVHVKPTIDVYSMLIASQDNGIVTQLINQDCQMSDLQGHPIKTALCGDGWVTLRYLEGDVNADCVVDVMDQQEVAFRWGSVLGMLLYSAKYDLEPSAPVRGDGDIDAKDLQV
ncbi:MAG: hypothetical protein ACREMY_13330, partial [bacterium]